MMCFENGLSVLLDINIWKDWSSIATPVVAIVGVVYAARQIFISKKEVRRATAYAVYNDYLKMCMDNPEFSCGLSDQETCQVKINKYKWFVSRMLFSFEQVIATCDSKNDFGWSITIKNQLKRHSAHLKVSKSVIRNEWSSELSGIISKII
ncbi:hypothetical protein [Pantoea stewartii]|uniref:hypothetical protein n=1 Tax=Pantoea stewartii TaxID=66269 RepID=UPI001982675E|nr:hypothetical protein [Pantoea stewartii]